jgi:FSR family fosmidomycin resistance protein-like MFS transporter
LNGRVSLLLLLILAHGLVDTFASLIQPLWPDLQGRLALEPGSIQWAYVTWSLATSVSQLLFGYWGDRYRGRWLIWAGPALGVICLSSIGLVHSLPMLNVLLVVGGLGIAAFHPEAAALAGASAPDNRSRAMSLFAVGGSAGQAFGPIYGGVISTQFGLRALAWSMTWGLTILAILGLGLRHIPEEPDARDQGRPSAWAGLDRASGAGLALVLLIGVLRVLAVLGVPLALAFALKARGNTDEQIGLAQGVFLAGVGGGSLGCALFVRRASERRVLWTLPLPVAPLLWLVPSAGFGLLLVAVGVAGMLLGATLPILISYGQQMLPEGQRTASSITMGVTWGLGGLVVAATMAACNRGQRPDLAFATFAVSCLLSSLLCAWLRVPAPAPPGVEAALAPQPR